MRKSAALAIIGAATLMLTTLTSVGAQAASTKGDDGSIIRGGTTQSVDPTRYDYVPAAQGGDAGIQPLSATGAQWISAFSYSWQGLTVPVPGGYIIHQIDGSGLHITQEDAWYTPSPTVVGAIWGANICNWRIDFQNRSASNGSIASTWSGLTNSGCYTTGVHRNVNNINVTTGVQCARLFINGVFRGEQCHSVSP